MSSVQQENFEGFLRANVLHMRSVILSEFSSVQLLRLAMTNKSMREISMTELGRRTLKINVYEEDKEIIDDILNPTTVIAVRKNGIYHREVIPNADTDLVFIEPYDVVMDDYITFCEAYPWIGNSCQIVTSLLKYSRVAELDMGDTILSKSWAETSGLRSSGRGLYLGRLTVHSELRTMEALDYLLPERLVITGDDLYCHDSFDRQFGRFMSRAMLHARELDIAVKGRDSMYAVCLPVLLAPIINFREKSRLKKKHLYGIIRTDLGELGKMLQSRFDQEGGAA